MAHDSHSLDIKSIADDGVLAKAILINYRPKGSAAFLVSYIFEAMLQIPKLSDPGSASRALLNNFISRDRQFDITVKGRPFVLRGVYFCQQTGTTHVCAHAALRMGLNTMNERDPVLSNHFINNTLGITLPCVGMSVQQVSQIITGAGYANNVFPSASKQHDIATICAIVESGYVALVVFTTETAEHVVPVFGHTINSDEWHPQAIREYSGPATSSFYSSSAWVDHFIIHDDNFGPYYTLSARALEVDPTVAGHWILPICPIKLETSPTTAEALAAFYTAAILRHIKQAVISSSKWLNYMLGHEWRYIFRTVLIGRSAYMDHLRSAKGHDQSRMLQADLAHFDGITDDQFWMVEISLPGIYTGNRSKLGEVLIRADAPSTDDKSAFDNLLSIRFPGMLLVKNNSGELNVVYIALDTHVPIYRVNNHDNQW